MLCRIDGTVPSTGTSEMGAQMCEPALHIPLHSMINQGIYIIQEIGNLTVFLKEFNHFGIKTGQMLVAVVPARVVHSPAIKHESATIAGIIQRHTFL